MALGQTMLEADHVYFERRASEEQTAARQARCGDARQAHLDMAERYEDLVRAIAERHQQLGFRPHSPTQSRTLVRDAS